jgi:REP element-mobilizing transposase RayT
MGWHLKQRRGETTGKTPSIAKGPLNPVASPLPPTEKIMKHRYDPRKHRRRSIRLRGWDYTSPGAYFVTICTHQHENLFDNDVFRDVTENAWRAIPTHAHAQHVTLDEWVLMPNHLHGIIVINEPVGRGEATGKDVPIASESSLPVASPLRPGSIGAIVGNFKSLVTRRINNLRRTTGGRVWQRGYYDRIVRNERELNAIRQYIRDNPARWAEDRENLDALVSRMRLVT